MKLSDVYPSRFLEAADIGSGLTATIRSVSVEEMRTRDGEVQRKPVIVFDGIEKPMVCNKTNWKAIAALYGDESDLWVGKTISLGVVDVSAFGEVVTAIRVKGK